MQTLPATIDENGVVHLLQPASFSSKHRAIVTVMDDLEPDDDMPKTEAERLAAVDASMGALAHIPFSSYDHMREKELEKQLEERRWKDKCK